MGQVLAALAGVAVIATVVWDGFETIVLPRRVSRRVRLTRVFYRTTWAPIAWIASRFEPGRKRDRYLSYYGPLSLVLLIIVWAVGLVLGFALLQWAVHSPLQTPEHLEHLGAYLYMSGVTFFTLGIGDVHPLADAGRVLAVVEAGTGFGFLAVVIGYLPVLYQSFSRREVTILMLDARARDYPCAATRTRTTTCVRCGVSTSLTSTASRATYSYRSRLGCPRRHAQTTGRRAPSTAPQRPRSRPSHRSSRPTTATSTFSRHLLQRNYIRCLDPARSPVIELALVIELAAVLPQKLLTPRERTHR